MSKIGVYICHCGRNIASVIDVDLLCRKAASLPGVTLAKTNVFCCAEPGQKEIQRDIQESGVDRVLVAACSPRLHEPTFRRTIEEAGLNRYLLEMANIREQCSWVHSPDKATEKAFDLLRMAVARLALMQPLPDRTVPVTRHALVLGGGIAGLKAALELADMAIPVILVEKEGRLGGHLAQWRCTLPGDDPPSCLIDPLITRAQLHPLIDIRLKCHVANIAGTIGSLTVTLRDQLQENENSGSDVANDHQETVGAVVVACGFDPYQPEPDRYPYAEWPQVSTSVELEKELAAGSDPFHESTSASNPVRHVAFQQCVGSRDPEHYPHCSRICCAITLKQALALRCRGIHVTVYHQDIRLYHKDQEEQLYQKARREGVHFHRGAILDVKPDDNGQLIITAEDAFLGAQVVRRVDRLVLALGLRPQADAVAVGQTLKVARSEDGFFLEAHPKLQPLETAMDGIFLAGTCQGPKDIRETVSTALGASIKAYQILSQDQLRLDGMIAVIDPETCVGCGTCEQECPYQAIELYTDEAGKTKAKVVMAACKGCGTCAGCCPTGAADHLGFSERSIKAQIHEALAKDPAHKILAFCCNWCAYAGADSAGVSRLSYPATVRIVRIPCSGRVSTRLILEAFKQGAGRVLVAGCHPPGDCHYISGNLRFQQRVAKIRRRLQKRGYNPDHFQLRWISATEGPLFQKTIEKLSVQLQQDQE